MHKIQRGRYFQKTKEAPKTMSLTGATQEGENELKTGGKEAEGTSHVSWLITLFKTCSPVFDREHAPLLPPRLRFIHQQALTELIPFADTELDPFYKDELYYGLHPQGTTDLLRNGHRNKKSGKSSDRGIAKFWVTSSWYNNFFAHRCCGAGDCVVRMVCLLDLHDVLDLNPGRHKAWLGDFCDWKLIHLVPGGKMFRSLCLTACEGTFLKQSPAAPCFSVSLLFLTVLSGCDHKKASNICPAQPFFSFSFHTLSLSLKQTVAWSRLEDTLFFLPSRLPLKVSSALNLPCGPSNLLLFFQNQPYWVWPLKPLLRSQLELMPASSLSSHSAFSSGLHRSVLL